MARSPEELMASYIILNKLTGQPLSNPARGRFTTPVLEDANKMLFTVLSYGKSVGLSDEEMQCFVVLDLESGGEISTPCVAN